MSGNLLSKIIALVIVTTIIFSTLAMGVQQGTVQQKGTIAGTIEIPEEEYRSPQKLAWDGSSLWFSNQNNGSVYKVNPSNGDVTDSFDTGLDSPIGIEANRSNIWVVSRNFGSDDKAIHSYDLNTGQKTGEIPAPGSRPGGIAYDGNNLWVTAEGTGGTKIFQVNPETGNVVSSIDAGDIFLRGGLAWGEGFLWAISNGDNIVQIDPSTPSSESVKEIASPYFVPTSIAWDGQYLWQSEGSNHTITRIAPGRIGQTNPPPNASFRYSPNQPTAGSQISFDASTSTDPNGFIESYQWDFDGDGISDAQSQRATYTYDSPGTYSINLTISDNNQVLRSTTKQITVSPDSKNRSGGGETNDPTSVQSAETPTTTRSESSNNLETLSETRLTPENTKSSKTSQTKTDARSEANGLQKERGFLSNGNEPDLLDFFSDPLTVTVAGFVVSTLGILVQLFGGR